MQKVGAKDHIIIFHILLISGPGWRGGLQKVGAKQKSYHTCVFLLSLGWRWRGNYRKSELSRILYVCYSCYLLAGVGGRITGVGAKENSIIFNSYYLWGGGLEYTETKLKQLISWINICQYLLTIHSEYVVNIKRWYEKSIIAIIWN